MNVTDITPFPLVFRRVDNFISDNDADNIKKFIHCVQGLTVGVQKHGLLETVGVSSHISSGTEITDNFVYNFFTEIDKQQVLTYSLQEKIQTALNQYTETFKIYPVEIGNAWFNVQYPGSKLTRHFHNQSVLSGVIWLDTHNISLRLYNPCRWQSWITKEANTSYDYYDMLNKKGTLVIFPSYVEHSADTVVQGSRVVLSFNTSLIE